jgi:hypothetical protein
MGYIAEISFLGFKEWCEDLSTVSVTVTITSGQLVKQCDDCYRLFVRLQPKNQHRPCLSACMVLSSVVFGIMILVLKTQARSQIGNIVI